MPSSVFPYCNDNNRAAVSSALSKPFGESCAAGSNKAIVTEALGTVQLTCILLSSISMNLHDLCKAGSEEAVDAYLQQLSADAADDLAFVLELKNELRYSPLHVSIFARWKL
jgi:hypothetical protein